MQNYIDIEKLNDEIRKNPQAVVDNCEISYRTQLEGIAKNILARKKPVKIILLGGPSCAGKTTSAKLIDSVLEEHGKKVISIEMDNFFISRDERPRLPNGSVDYDSINIVDLKLMKKCFTELFETGKAMFPTYDFVNGVSVPNSELVEADKDTIIIFEGIHTLNPKLTKELGTDDFYKIFINNGNGYKLGNTKIEPREFRMVRRMVRDVQFRGVSMANTVKHWKDVTDAEDLYIIPFSNDVDSKINTSHDFEIALFRGEVMDAFEKGEIDKEKLSFLDVFEKTEDLDEKLLPSTTLMKEFLNLDK